MNTVVYQKRVIALAGLLQSVHLVSSIAHTGLVSQDSMEHSLRSIFVLNPDSISEVFSGTEGIRTGLKLLGEVLGRFDFRAHGDLLRYSLAVIKLERTLAAMPGLSREIGARIASIDERRMLRQDGSRGLDEATISALAELYEQTLSRIEPRIRVSGKPNYLQNAHNVDRIRALLLSAVRSAVLWHQVGGRRWQLLLARGQLNHALEYL